MKKFQAVRLKWFLVISGFLFNTCKKQETFDLFPLKGNNEFYYKYEHRISYGAVDDLTKGTETWKVVSEYEQENSFKYIIERKLNDISVISLLGGDTTIISDSIRYFEISEDKFIFFNLTRGFNF